MYDEQQPQGMLLFDAIPTASLTPPPPTHRPSACPGPKLALPLRVGPAPVAGRIAGRVGELADGDGRVEGEDDSWPAGRTALGDRRV